MATRMRLSASNLAVLLIAVIASTDAFVVVVKNNNNHHAAITVRTTRQQQPQRRLWSAPSADQENQIISPFDTEARGGDSVLDQVIAMTGGDMSAYEAGQQMEEEEADEEEAPLDLTWENVEAVLDTMREYLIADGGNVAIQEIDGPVVRLELQGACGTCPSSTQTMKMGLERKLKERIPEIQEVVQSMPEGPPLEEDQINIVLDGVRPFLQVAGGEIDIVNILGIGSTQPSIVLKMEGASASLKSVRLEIAQRLQRHFMISGLQIQWDDENDDDNW